MLNKLGKVFSSPLKRSPEQRLQAALETLAAGWSLEAFKQLQACAEEGMAQAQFEMGKRYEEALGVVQNLGDAVHWYGLAAKQSHLAALSRLGLIYMSPSLPSAAIATSGKSSADQVPTSNSALGATFKQGFTVTQDFEQAFTWNKLAAEAGDAEAQARLGNQYTHGLGTTADPAQGKHWFEKSAAQGCVNGIYPLGKHYADEIATNPQALQLAIKWLYKAAIQDHADAQYGLGMLIRQNPDADFTALPLAERAPLMWFKKSALQGHENAMSHLGFLYWRGPNEHDLGLAETWLRRAVGRGQVDAMRWLGQLLLEQPDDDGVDAANLIRQAAEGGDATAASLLGEMYLSGKGLPRDAAEAERWLTEAGDIARPQAMTALAGMQARSSNGQGYSQAAQWLLKAAESGNVAAKYTLGSLYAQGKGVPASPQESAKWYLQAAQAGSTPAAFYLGMLYADTTSTIHNDQQALHWLRVAAKGGHAVAHCNMAMMVMKGRGQPSDPNRALVMLASAASKGNVQAASMLVQWASNGSLSNAINPKMVPVLRFIGQCFLNGKGCRSNPSESVRWFSLAAQQGDVEAQYLLACCHADGTGTRTDWPVARLWFERAAAKHHALAQQRLEARKSLTAVAA